MTENPKMLIFTDKFQTLLGRFHAAWSSVDMVSDFAIGKFLKLPLEQTHLMTAGMMSGPKLRLLADLIKRNDHPKKSQLLGALNKIRNEVKREVITHAYIQSSADAVIFLNRKAGGQYKAKQYPFTLREFAIHVKVLTQAGDDFEVALGMTQEEVNEFSAAALRANDIADPDTDN